jgi:uncharacterized protein YcaQ
MALRSQGLLGATHRPRQVPALLDLLGGLQLDTISVLARSHELVCYSRLGAIGREAVERAVWSAGPDGWPRTIEYWAHAACILPVASWPWFAFRRRRFRDRARWDLAAPEDTITTVRERLVAEGPLTATELGGAKRGGPWWDWSPVKMAVELMLDWGEVVCVARRGWKRVYDMTERALPPSVLGKEPNDAACFGRLVAAAGSSLGVATKGDLAEYFRLKLDEVAIGLPSSGLIPLHVDGWSQPAWAAPDALAALGGRGRHRTTLLSPFDSLIWDQPRTTRIFGFTHRLEAYTPASKRVFGYYAMPVLSGGQLVGRVDPGRDGRTLVAKRVQLSRPAAVPAVAEALLAAAQWVGADSVAVGVVDPPALRQAIIAALP